MEAVALLLLAVLAEGPGLRAGEGVADITPPPGTELAGFHKPPSQERRAQCSPPPRSPAAIA